MQDENYISDIKEPPKYDWFVRIPKTKEDTVIPEEQTEECYCTVVELKKEEFKFVKNCLILNIKNKKIGFFEDTYKFYKHVLNKKLKIFWHGKSEQTFFGRKSLNYEKGLENTNELFFYKSIILKILLK